MTLPSWLTTWNVIFFKHFISECTTDRSQDPNTLIFSVVYVVIPCLLLGASITQSGSLYNTLYTLIGRMFTFAQVSILALKI